VTANQLRQCRWPPLAEPFDKALRDAVAFIFGQVEPIGIVATGTIIRGAAHASSDLDIYVIHAAPYRRRVQQVFLEVPTEIFINPPPAIREYFVEEHRDGRPLTAHMLATGFIVYAASSVVDELRTEARTWLERRSEVSAEEQRSTRYAIATRLEDGFDVIDTDGSTATMLLGGAVTAMLEFFCKARLGRIPRSKDLLATVAAEDAGLGSLATAFFEAPTVSERAETARALADGIIGVTGFFAWDSGVRPVPRTPGEHAES
jgi:predicted nucleotidyltransferase